MQKKKEEKAITLIALIVTIIVLLILAGVTIATLNGDNGLLQKAASAKQANETATALENIQAEVAGSYGPDGKIDLDELNKNLKRVNGLKYNDADIVLDGENKNIIEELPTEVSLNQYSFSIEESGKVSDITQANRINSKIGEVVQGYSAANLEWQVYYADSEETYLISKILVQENTDIPLKGKNKTENYRGSADVRETEYGKKWNKTWLDKCASNTTIGGDSPWNNAKAIAYLSDPDNWNDYKIGPAKYAAGGPTLELLIASWNKSQGKNVKLPNLGANGYETYKPQEFNSKLRNWIKKGVYYNDVDYYVVSPDWKDSSANGAVSLKAVRDSSLSFSFYYAKVCGIRPIVSIPTSKISVNGDTVTVNP